jgi:hypothetical protein
MSSSIVYPYKSKSTHGRRDGKGGGFGGFYDFLHALIIKFGWNEQ